jgi:hypothetical protein
MSNGHSIIETERLSNDNDERYSNVIPPSPSQHKNEPFINNYSHHIIRNSQSIPLLNRHDNITTRINSIPYGIRGLNNGIDSFSFTDIEVASSINDDGNNKQKNLKSIATNDKSISIDIDRHNDDDLQSATPKSLASRDFSSAATNLSAYSTQSLLRRLLDKAHVLNEYYNDICTRTTVQPPRLSPSRKRSSSTSTNSLLGRTGVTPRSLLHRDQSNESIRKSRRKNRSIYDNMSADSSRFNLYADEDNVLRELIRFNNDIDLILSRLEMEGENVQQINNSNENNNNERHSLSSTQMLLDDNDPESTESKLDDLKNLIQQANIYPSDDSGLAASPQINDR